MRRKRVTLMTGLKEISEASTSSATFATVMPPEIIPARSLRPAIKAQGAKLLLTVYGRTSNDGAALSLNINLQERDSRGNWHDLAGSTMTPVVTATTFETLELHPRIDATSAPPRKAIMLPQPCRVLARLQGSITATPGISFDLEADLLE